MGHNGGFCPSLDSKALAAAELALDQIDDNAAPPQARAVPDPPPAANQPPWIDSDDIEDDLLWEDIPDNSTPFTSTPPPRDEFGNPFLLIVDASQLLSLPVMYCGCASAASEDLQLLDSRFFPASFKEVKTAFTFNCLDDFRLSNLECKTSAYQYFQRLRRLTNPAFPNSVPNRYAELRRVSRQWRNLKLRKWFGFGHTSEQPGRGQMALFCPACPQPGVNLPPDWEAQYTE